MPLSTPVSNARDTILLLMIKYGLVQRKFLIRAYQNSGEEAVVVTADVINSLLNLIAKKALNGMVLKLNDDMTFETRFQTSAALHEMYWQRKSKELETYIQLYDNELHSK